MPVNVTLEWWVRSAYRENKFGRVSNPRARVRVAAGAVRVAVTDVGVASPFMKHLLPNLPPVAVVYTLTGLHSSLPDDVPHLLTLSLVVDVPAA